EATIGVHHVAVVALLDAEMAMTIAAHREAAVDAAVRVARVAVVALLVVFATVVAAHLDLAEPIAAIAARHVAVVAFLAGGVVANTVAALRRRAIGIA